MDKEELRRFTSYLGSIKTEKKAKSSRENGKKNKGKKRKLKLVIQNGLTKPSKTISTDSSKDF